MFYNSIVSEKHMFVKRVETDLQNYAHKNHKIVNDLIKTAENAYALKF